MDIYPGWWFQPTPLKNHRQLVSWDDDIPFPIDMESHKNPWFQTTKQITNIFPLLLVYSLLTTINHHYQSLLPTNQYILLLFYEVTQKRSKRSNAMIPSPSTKGHFPAAAATVLLGSCPRCLKRWVLQELLHYVTWVC